MNVQRIAAIAAITGAVLGGASVVALGAAAYSAGQPRAELVSSPIDDSADSDDSQTEQGGPSAAGVGTGGQDSQLAAASGTDTNAADYNPYLDPLNEQYVTPEARSEWLGKQVVIRECMAEAGFEFLEWQWWVGGSPQPTGFDYETTILWSQALYGPDINNPGGGCASKGDEAEAAARAAGRPLSGAETPVDPEAATEREIWLEFQQRVRDCMAEAGHEYLYFEWWNPDGSEPQPLDLTEAERTEWNLALHGNAAGGAAYRWEDAGCWGRAVHESGNDNMH